MSCLVMCNGSVLHAAHCQPWLLRGAPTQSTYTGVYKKGGPSCVDPGKQLSDLVDRSSGEAKGRRKASVEVSPLQNAASNSGVAPCRPAPVITTLLPATSGRCVPPCLECNGIMAVCTPVSSDTKKRP